MPASTHVEIISGKNLSFLSFFSAGDLLVIKVDEPDSVLPSIGVDVAPIDTGSLVAGDLIFVAEAEGGVEFFIATSVETVSTAAGTSETYAKGVEVITVSLTSVSSAFNPTPG